MSIVFGPDPIELELNRILLLLEQRRYSKDESALVDLKEESGRRDHQGAVLPGEKHNELAAEQVAGEMACMANTPGGGALILGAGDSGELIGTKLDREWLRHRVFELSGKALTIDVRSVRIRDARLLLIRAPQAVEPIRWKGKVYWRVDDHCVEVDPATWHEQRLTRIQFDWSAQESHLAATDARPSAIGIVREFLKASNEPHALELSQQTDSELLRRLNVVTPNGMLTNAGVLVFVGRGEPALDYIRRDFSGGDSRARIRTAGRSLIEELSEVLTYTDANNAIRHIGNAGLVIGQLRDLPQVAIREAIVNGLAHRDWISPEPTVVEHIDRTLRVTSPGGFYGGVSPANIITHPSRSRNTALTELLATIRVAEREGVGVDRMVRAMIRVGYQPPEIGEIAGPYVRTSLVGDIIDEPWISWLNSLNPKQTSEDLNSLLLLDHLAHRLWIDLETAAPLLQLNTAETLGALQRLSRVQLENNPVIIRVSGAPDDAAQVYTLNRSARQLLEKLGSKMGQPHRWPSRNAVARDYAAAHGRISTTELGAIVGASGTNVGTVLMELEAEGILEPSRLNRRGPGFFYRWIPAAAR